MTDMKHEAINMRRVIRAQRLLAEQGHAGDTLAALDEMAALRKDAERYRWLRDVASGGDWEHIGQTTDPTNTDARVDECMAAYKAVGAA